MIILDVRSPESKCSWMTGKLINQLKEGGILLVNGGIKQSSGLVA